MVEAEVPLAPLTSFRLGGPASFLARPRSHAELADVLLLARDSGLPLRMLGGGTNLLVADEGVRAFVLRLSGDEFGGLQIQDNIIRAGAAVPTARAISAAAEAGLSGLEFLAGIPGTVGGAVSTNAGGVGGSIGGRVRSVTAMSPAMRPEVISFGELAAGGGFTFDGRALSGMLVTSVELGLAASDGESVRAATRAALDRRLATQPTGERSAGCVFRNPPGADPAGKIIDQLGLKGLSVGGAAVSEVHANYIVAREGATSADVLALIDLIRSRVLDDREIELELEIEVWR